MSLLANDPVFKDKSCYLVTAVQEQPNGMLKQRRFLLTEDQAEKIGAHKLNPGQKIGNGTSIILDQKMTLGALGQYLESMGARIFPRAQTVQSTLVQPVDAQRVNKALHTSPETKAYVNPISWKYGNSHNGIAP